MEIGKAGNPEFRQNNKRQIKGQSRQANYVKKNKSRTKKQTTTNNKITTKQTTSENKAIVKILNYLSRQVSFTEIETDKGHDSFLLEEPELDFVIKGFLESNFETNE